jgi:hypothetical protein
MLFVVPLAFSQPSVQAVSGSSLNITWKKPQEIPEARGEITQYLIYHLLFNNLTVNPFAPPSYWKVHLALLLNSHITIVMVSTR